MKYKQDRNHRKEFISVRVFRYESYMMIDADVGGKRCPDSVRVYCTVSVRQNLKFSVGRVFECSDFEFELDFDRQTPHSKSRQNPDSAVRRRLPLAVEKLSSWFGP